LGGPLLIGDHLEAEDRSTVKRYDAALNTEVVIVTAISVVSSYESNLGEWWPN